MELVTTEKILTWMEEQVTQKFPVSPEMWLDAGMKLNVLRGDEDDKMWVLKQECNKLKLIHLESGDNGIKAKTKLEASDLYRETRQLESKIERIKEHILLAKKMATLKSEEMRGGSINV